MRSDPDLIQIMHPDASKAAALRTVAAHYGVPMEQVMAIGDAANDIPMLQAAGVAVAMDNASDFVKAAADWIAPSNEDHGVHAALERYGLTWFPVGLIDGRNSAGMMPTPHKEHA